MAEFAVPEGTTEPLDFQLLSAGLAINGTGFTLGLVLRDKTGVLVSMAGGKVTWLNQPAGTVRYTPVTADLVASKGPYSARWTLTAAGGAVAYVPNGFEPDIWKIGKS